MDHFLTGAGILGLIAFAFGKAVARAVVVLFLLAALGLFGFVGFLIVTDSI